MKAICTLKGSKKVIAELNLDWPPHRWATFKTEDKREYQIVDFDDKPDSNAAQFNVIVIPWTPKPEDVEQNPRLQ
jgi:hypothetical protein